MSDLKIMAGHHCGGETFQSTFNCIGSEMFLLHNDNVQALKNDQMLSTDESVCFSIVFNCVHLKAVFQSYFLFVL